MPSTRAAARLAKLAETIKPTNRQVVEAACRLQQMKLYPSPRDTPTLTTTFWEAYETYVFPRLLGSFGSDWDAIAAYMESKTAGMVKDYYTRHTTHGGNKDWEKIVEIAEAKIQRGLKMPEPPFLGQRYGTTDDAAAFHDLYLPGT